MRISLKRRPHGQSFINHKLEISSNSHQTPVQTINLLFDFCVRVIDKLCFRFCSKASNKSLKNIVNLIAFQFLFYEIPGDIVISRLLFT